VSYERALDGWASTRQPHPGTGPSSDNRLGACPTPSQLSIGAIQSHPSTALAAYANWAERARKVRVDYFGLGLDNASYFSIPINLPSGTEPNSGYFGALGRNTFRGPAYYDFDFSLIKDTPVGSRSSGGELFDVQFRAEFFNLFNIVNMGLPANTIEGSGFGYICKTAGTSRQIQFSLKLLY
jgi:hypothetical protein